jgi:hypothetical protein
VPNVKLSFEGSIPSLSIVLEQIVVLLVDPCLNPLIEKLSFATCLMQLKNLACNYFGVACDIF